MTTGECLRYMREGRGWYMTEVAEILGLSLNSLANWELGKCAIPFEKAVQLCRFYGMPVSALAKSVKELNAEDVEYRKNVIMEIRGNGGQIRKSGKKEGASSK